MLLILVINYYVIKNDISIKQENKTSTETQKSQICLCCHLCVITEKHLIKPII